jgi:hypothetical protein
MTSNLIEGNKEQMDEGNKRASCITSSLLPTRIEKFLPRVKDLVLVHTHPIGKELDHLRNNGDVSRRYFNFRNKYVFSFRNA